MGSKAYCGASQICAGGQYQLGIALMMNLSGALFATVLHYTDTIMCIALTMKREGRGFCQGHSIYTGAPVIPLMQ